MLAGCNELAEEQRRFAGRWRLAVTLKEEGSKISFNEFLYIRVLSKRELSIRGLPDGNGTVVRSDGEPLLKESDDRIQFALNSPRDTAWSLTLDWSRDCPIHVFREREPVAQGEYYRVKQGRERGARQPF